MYNTISLLTLLLFFPIALQGQNTDFLKVTAQAGDGGLVLLNRYKLDRHSCNLGEFFRLNKLKNNSVLVAGRTYYLPVKLVKYNGTSVQKSLSTKDKAYAQRIELYNNKVVRAALKESSFVKDKVLWVPYGELKCPNSELKEDKPKHVEVPIFGDKYKTVTVKDQKLKDAVYYLISGHGGPDPGAMVKHGKRWLCEDEYAYDVTLRLARLLMEHGATVYIIVRDKNDGIRDDELLKPDTDEFCLEEGGIPVNQKMRLGQRVRVINRLHKKHLAQGQRYQRSIEIHVDSRAKKQQIDLFFYHQIKSTTGKILANSLHQLMKKKYAANRKNGKVYDGSVGSRDLFMLRELEPVSVFIELGNIRNQFDLKRLLPSSNRQAIANWLAEGLLGDY